MTQKLTQENIKEHIIHRHENLLLDSISIPKSEIVSGDLSLTINKNDTLNRSIFLKEHRHGTLVLQTPLLMEILALAAIVVSGKLKENEMVMFAAISNFKAMKHYDANKTLTGHVRRINAKNNFLKYEGYLKQDNLEIATGGMTAIFTTNTHTTTPEQTTFEKPSKEGYTINKKNRHKKENMIIIDTLYITDNEIISKYTYPDTHPLTKGHFPNNPIMMGVMQWMSIEDALCAYLEKTNETGNHQWSCNASLYNQHNHKIADIKDITLKSWINDPETPNQTEIQTTKRINFRNMVKPNDTIYTVLTNLTKP